MYPSSPQVEAHELYKNNECTVSDAQVERDLCHKINMLNAKR